MIVLERMVCDVETVLHRPPTVPAELRKFIQNGLPLQRKLKIAHDTVLGISWLHDILNIVHR